MTRRPLMVPRVNKKSAPRSGRKGGDDHMSMCSFCGETPSALLIQLPVLGRKKRAATPYCLKCYYTTSAVRQDPEKFVSILDKEEHANQLPTIQNLFSECFLELQHELAEESARAFKKQQSDPLAMLSFSSSSGSSFSSKKKRKLVANKGQAPDPRKKQEGKANDGGFLLEIDLPERLRRTQQEQQELQNQQLARMNQAASAARRASRATPTNNSVSGGSTLRTTAVPSMNKRRKGSGKSIWNLAMDKGRDGKLSTTAENYKSTEGNSSETANVACSCGSRDVRSFGNITSRNQEVRKGEIWGTDRGEEVINRYQCNKCGRTWNEVE